MAFSGDKPIFENVQYDVSGSAVALTNSASIDYATQAGLALVGIHSGTSGFTAQLLTVDDEGRLNVNAEIVPAGVQTVTGTVSLDRGDSALVPLFITGSVGVAGTVGITGSVALTQPAVITGTVHLDRGDSFVLPIFTTGSVSVTGLVATREAVATLSSGTFFPASTSVQTLLVLNSNRRGAIVYNTSNKAMYVKFGTGASAADFTVKVFSDDNYCVPALYAGAVTGVWVNGATGGAMVTELQP